MDRESSLAKALRLLFAVGESADPSGISVVDLVRTTGLSRPTAYRFLKELQQFGLVKAVPRQSNWQLGPKVIALAAMAGNWATLRRRARQAMEEFVRTEGYTVHLGLRDGFEVVYIDKAESPHHTTISSVIGQRRPLHVTALGKCLVAFDANPNLVDALVEHGLAPRTPHSVTDPAEWRAQIDRVRREGIAFDEEECDVGARCVAAPIKDPQGYALAAISLTALTARPDEIDMMPIAAKLKRLADDISLSTAS